MNNRYTTTAAMPHITGITKSIISLLYGGILRLEREPLEAPTLCLHRALLLATLALYVGFRLT